MTYGGQSETKDERAAALAAAKQNIEQAVLDSVRRQLSTVELTVESDNVKYTNSAELAPADIYKLVKTINDEEHITEINDVPNSKLIIGAIDNIDESNTTKFSIGKTVFCLDNDLVEGSLIIAGNKIPHYVEIQKDDIVRASTIGKVIQIYHDRCIYFDMTNEAKNSSEYELSKMKRLQLNTNVAIVRRPSISRALIKNQKPSTPSPLTRRPSVSNQSIPTPRMIMRYKLIRFL